MNMNTVGGLCAACSFPYFHVEFGLDGGFAHVIEDAEQFPQNFGKSVICGLLEEPAEFLLRHKSQTKPEVCTSSNENSTANA
jgi:hypothetical protein